MSSTCEHRDPETGECMRRLTTCTCNPPRCYVCGRFSTTWGADHPDCEARALADEESTLRYDVETQAGLS